MVSALHQLLQCMHRFFCPRPPISPVTDGNEDGDDGDKKRQTDPEAGKVVVCGVSLIFSVAVVIAVGVLLLTQKTFGRRKGERHIHAHPHIASVGYAGCKR